MNREDIIKIAQEIWATPNWTYAQIERLERFAALVAAAEREKFFTKEEALILLEDTDFSWWQSVTQEMFDKVSAIAREGENT